MSNWLESIKTSQKLQLAATAVVSGFVVGGAILGLQQAKRRYRVESLKESIPDLQHERNIGRV